MASRPRAKRALVSAEIVAKATGATLYLVSVLDGLPDPHISLLSPSYLMNEITAQREERLAYLQRHVQRLAADGIAAHGELLDSTGEICGTILAFEQRAKIDLTVLATHGRIRLTRWSLGSVAERLVQHGRIPVLLVRVQPRDTPTPQAVVPLDGSKAGETALPVMMHLGTSLIQTAVLLQVIDDPKRRDAAMTYLNGVADRLTASGLRCECRVEEGDPAEQILKIGDTSRVIVMTTHGHSEILGRSLGIVVAGHVVHHSAAPRAAAARYGKIISTARVEIQVRGGTRISRYLNRKTLIELRTH